MCAARFRPGQRTYVDFDYGLGLSLFRPPITRLTITSLTITSHTLSLSISLSVSLLSFFTQSSRLNSAETLDTRVS